MKSRSWQNTHDLSTACSVWAAEKANRTGKILSNVISLEERRALKEAVSVRTSNYEKARAFIEEDVERCRHLLISGWIMTLSHAVVVATVGVPVALFWSVLFSGTTFANLSDIISSAGGHTIVGIVWLMVAISDFVIGPGPKVKIHAEINRVAAQFRALNLD